MVQEDEEALRSMMVDGVFSGDRRADGDPDWLANGAHIELFGLTSDRALYLNGQTAEVVGFDDQHRRYRVKLHEDSTVKVVAKKNMRLLLMSESEPEVVNDIQHSFSQALVLGPQPFPSNPPMPLELNVPTARVELVPTTQTVQRAVDRVVHNTNVLRQQCLLRQSGMDCINMSDTYMGLNTAIDTYLEVMERYKTAYSIDEELQALGSAAVQNAEKCMEDYKKIRTWAEMGIDEINLTKYSIGKHGLVGTLKNEFVEVGRDVAEVGGGAAAMVRSGASTVPVCVRQASSTLSGVAQQSRRVAQQASSVAINRGNQQAQAALHHQIIGPAKRTWHLLVTGVFLCYILPLFALRAYAPLNSVVANVGLVYTVLCLCCPPRCASGRRAKAGLLVLWPLLMVVLPLALHYWLLHPEMFHHEDSSQLGNHGKLFDKWSSQPPQPPQPAASTDTPKNGTAAKPGEKRGPKAVAEHGSSVAWVELLRIRVHDHRRGRMKRYSHSAIASSYKEI